MSTQIGQISLVFATSLSLWHRSPTGAPFLWHLGGCPMFALCFFCVWNCKWGCASAADGGGALFRPCTCGGKRFHWGFRYVMWHERSVVTTLTYKIHAYRRSKTTHSARRPPAGHGQRRSRRNLGAGPRRLHQLGHRLDGGGGPRLPDGVVDERAADEGGDRGEPRLTVTHGKPCWVTSEDLERGNARGGGILLKVPWKTAKTLKKHLEFFFG